MFGGKPSMLVASCRSDQPGNAARVVRHGLGRRVDVGRVTIDELPRSVEACLEDADIAGRIAAMSEAFRTSDEEARWMADILSHDPSAPEVTERVPPSVAVMQADMQGLHVGRSRAWGRTGPVRRAGQRTRMALATNKKPALAGWLFVCVVEPGRIELPTSSLRTTRSPS